ncbi:MAG: hypothetical protein RLZZ28_855 [Bacteroidota bacterium]|jgi:hypothetical protein
MNTQKFLVSGIVGGIMSFFAGYLIYGLVMADFFAKHGGTDTAAMKKMEEYAWWALVVGSLFQGFLLSYIFNKWANITSLGNGAVAGGVVGFFVSGAFDFMMFATTNLSTIESLIADVLCGAVMYGLIGAAVGFMNGVGKKAA